VKIAQRRSGLGYDFCNRSSSLAILAPTRRSSSRVSSFAAERRPRLVLELDVGERPPVVVGQRNRRPIPRQSKAAGSGEETLFYVASMLRGVSGSE
jgi:hypothetical protein